MLDFPGILDSNSRLNISSTSSFGCCTSTDSKNMGDMGTSPEGKASVGGNWTKSPLV